MRRFMAAIAAALIAMGASAWAAETPGAAKRTATPPSKSAPTSSSAKTTTASSAVTTPAAPSMAAPTTASTVEGTILAVELTELVPTLTIRGIDGVRTKVRVDATTSVWQDGATPTRVTPQLLRVEQHVTATGTQQEGLFQAASINIAAPQSTTPSTTPLAAGSATTTASSPAEPDLSTH